MTAPGGGERRREPLVDGPNDIRDLTTPEVMQAAGPESANIWRGDARPAFRDLLEAEAINPDEEIPPHGA